MKLEIYLSLGLLLLLSAYVVFRLVVRRDYREHSRLRALASSLQLLVFGGYFSFPYLFNPPDWPWFWLRSDSALRTWYLIGGGLICLGFLVAFGTMAWFGIGRAFGMKVEGLRREGPYRISRNPQVLGGYLLVIGTTMQWPSLYGVGWLLMYAVVTHWMVITEEEHLSRVFGEDYERYRSHVPRYLFGLQRHGGPSA